MRSLPNHVQDLAAARYRGLSGAVPTSRIVPSITMIERLNNRMEPGAICMLSYRGPRRLEVFRPDSLSCSSKVVRSPGLLRLRIAGSALLLVALLVASWARPALAWGRLGHRASAKLTFSRLTPKARAVIRDLLEPGESLADASTWADENGREISGSAAWHYVNVHISSPHYTARDCRPQGCVVSKIAEFRAILSDRNASKARRRLALRFLVHLVQDLHQPMHVADRRDRGGNNLQLRYGRFDATNLHQVWDSGLLKSRYRNENELWRDLSKLADQPGSRDWLKGRVEDWADESLELGRRAYQNPRTHSPLRSGDRLNRDYERENLPRAVERLAQAGVRLAELLNAAFQ
jgi:nuclease S1